MPGDLLVLHLGIYEQCIMYVCQHHADAKGKGNCHTFDFVIRVPCQFTRINYFCFEVQEQNSELYVIGCLYCQH
jgi:hypothetical protein